MKTLDEVIKADECCDHGEPDSRCEDCPYNGIGACCAERETDALYYLKEYRETKKHLACLDDAEIRGDDTQVVNNHPLTWDELQAMEGKPVWVEEKYTFSNEWHGRWEVICSVWDDEWDDDPYLSMTNEEYRHKDDMGERWQAYRKER